MRTLRQGWDVHPAHSKPVVPAAVFAIFPYYRDYRYVVVEDTICIVDFVTCEIVDSWMGVLIPRRAP